MATVFIPTKSDKTNDTIHEIGLREDLLPLMKCLKDAGFKPLKFVCLRNETSMWGWCWAWSNEEEVIEKFGRVRTQMPALEPTKGGK